jgi:hypothetical protein
MRFSIAALTLLVACAPPLPGEPVDPPEGVDVAAEIAMGEWSERLLAPGRQFEIPDILWFDMDCFPIESGDCVPAYYGSGRFYRPEIHIVTRVVSEPFPADDISHELLHAALDQMGEAYGDGEHLRPEWEQVHDVSDIASSAF